MNKDLTFALNARAALQLMRRKLADAGVDITEVKYLTDIPAVLATTLPDDLTEVFPSDLVALAEALLADEAALEQLFANFQRIAGEGVVPDMMTRPEE